MRITWDGFLRHKKNLSHRRKVALKKREAKIEQDREILGEFGKGFAAFYDRLVFDVLSGVK